MDATKATKPGAKIPKTQESSLVFWLSNVFKSMELAAPEANSLRMTTSLRPRTLSSSWWRRSRWMARLEIWETRSASTEKRPRSMWLLSLLSPSVTSSIWARSTWSPSSFFGSRWCFVLKISENRKTAFQNHRAQLRIPAHFFSFLTWK